MDLAHKKARNLTKNHFNSLVELLGDIIQLISVQFHSNSTTGSYY